MTPRPAAYAVLSFAAAMLAAWPAPASAGAEDPLMPRPSTEVSPPRLEDVWNDPGFRRSFVGGYGISPDVEPRISQDDLALLELVRQLIQTTSARPRRCCATRSAPRRARCST